jgi:hypothetical protein
MEATMFQEELEFFKNNQAALVEKYGGRVLAIKGDKVLGVYNSALDALKETTKEHKLGSFMIQPCHPGADAYTITISSLGLIKTKA